MSTNQNNIPGISPRQLTDDLMDVLRAPDDLYDPLLLYGIPGVGKTSIVQQVANALSMDVFVIRPSSHEGIEFTGLPVNASDNGHAVWKPFEDLIPTDPAWDGVIFIDECGQCDLPMHKVIGSLIDRAGVAGRRVPVKAKFVLASNRQQDRAGSTRMLTITESRCRQQELLFSSEDWKHWAVDHDIDQTVISFADFKGGEFVRFDPALSLNPLPRSWHKVSKYITVKNMSGTDTSKDNPIVRAGVGGYVGVGMAAEYMAFREHFAMLHGVVDQVFEHPDKVTVGDDLSVQHALIGAVTHRLKEKGNNVADKEVVNLITFARRCLPKSLQALMLLNSMSVSVRKVGTHPDFVGWCREHAAVIASWQRK